MGGFFGGFGNCNGGCGGINMNMDCCTLIFLLIILGQCGCNDITWLILILLLCGCGNNTPTCH